MTALVGVRPDRLSAAYAYCESLARRHYENFPVASRLLPAAMRPHIAAIYAFARAADDFADEPGIATVDRLRLLDYWELRLARGDGSLSAVDKLSVPVDDDLIFCALANTIRTHELPSGLFEDLLSAFRQDVTTTRYATWGDVLDYCRRSAHPIGRLVLRVAGYSDPRTDAAADAVCTALQLTNFWQDLATDWSNGRLYLPLEERDRTGAREEDLAAGRLTREWKSAMRAGVDRARGLFEAGRPVCDGVSGRLRWELRMTCLGGVRILDKLQAADFDVLRHRPTLGIADIPVLVWQAMMWKSEVSV